MSWKFLKINGKASNNFGSRAEIIPNCYSPVLDLSLQLHSHELPLRLTLLENPYIWLYKGKTVSNNGYCWLRERDSEYSRF